MDDLRTADTWSPEDDAFIRGALLSLRADVDAGPLPEPAFVRARGDATRRRRMLAITAGVAAAVVIVGALGFRGLADEDAAPPPLPGTPTPTLATNAPTTTTSPTPTPSPTASATASPSRTAATATGTATSTSRPTSTSTPTGGPTGGTSTPPEILTRGTPAISPSLFLTAGQWDAATDLALTVGSWVPEEATVGAVTPCDPNADATPAAVAWMRDEGESEWTGAERIQASNLQSDGDTNAGEPAAIVRAMLNDATCTESTDPVVTLEAGPRTGTIAVTYSYPDGDGPHTDLVGAVALSDGVSTATFVLRDTRESDRGWAFLGSLMDAAAAK